MVGNFQRSTRFNLESIQGRFANLFQYPQHEIGPLALLYSADGIDKSVGLGEQTWDRTADGWQYRR
jgi:hypothetical protein